MLSINIWQVEYSLLIKFACSYLKDYNATGIYKGFLQVVYDSDLQAWALERMKEVTAKASRLRNGRKLDEYVVNEIRELSGYKQLVELMR